MALAAPIISFQPNPSAAASNLANNTTAFCDPGASVTFALQSSTGVLWAEFVIQAPNTPLDGLRSPRMQGNGPFSWNLLLPNYPVQFTISSEVTDGTNISVAQNSIIANFRVAGNEHRARSVSAANNESLTAFVGVTGGAPRDGVTLVQGDYVLLAGQTSKAQNGLYVVGVVASGTAPLTRVADFSTGTVLQAGQEVAVSEGTQFSNTRWFISTAGAITVDTTAHDWYPESVTQSVTLTTGFVTVTNVPILSLTRTAINFQPTNFSGAASTVSYRTGAYTSGGAATVAGIAGTASASITALVAAGTFNTNDVGTGMLTITNR